MNLNAFNSKSAIWFDENCYGFVVCKTVEGELLRTINNRRFCLTNLEVIHAQKGVLSEKQILKNLTRISGEYRDILNFGCNNSLLTKTIKLPVSDSHFQEFNNSIEAIVKVKTLLADKRILFPEELKDLFQQELDYYHPVENQTPLVSALLMAVLQVQEFFEQIYLDLRPNFQAASYIY